MGNVIKGGKAKPGPVYTAKPVESAGQAGASAGGGSSIDQNIYKPGIGGTAKAPR